MFLRLCECVFESILNALNVFFKKDASTHSPVGHFLPAQGMKPMSECSAVTHSDSRPKKAVNLVWQAPNHPGQVIFRYETFLF